MMAAPFELASLVLDAGETEITRYAAQNSFALVSVTVDQVRTLKFGSADGTKTGLKVAYTPQDASQFGPANPYHADIFPGPSESASKALTKLKIEIIPIDQQRAAIEYAKKFEKK